VSRQEHYEAAAQSAGHSGQPGATSHSDRWRQLIWRQWKEQRRGLFLRKVLWGLISIHLRSHEGIPLHCLHPGEEVQRWSELLQ